MYFKYKNFIYYYNKRESIDYIKKMPIIFCFFKFRKLRCAVFSNKIQARKALQSRHILLYPTLFGVRLACDYKL